MAEPQFKVCTNCGALCGDIDEEVISICPNHNCQASDFRYLTMEEFKRMDNDGKYRVYFKKWPDWPTEEAWHQIVSKDDLGRSPPK